MSYRQSLGDVGIMPRPYTPVLNKCGLARTPSMLPKMSQRYLFCRAMIYATTICVMVRRHATSHSLIQQYSAKSWPNRRQPSANAACYITYTVAHCSMNCLILD